MLVVGGVSGVRRLASPFTIRPLTVHLFSISSPLPGPCINSGGGLLAVCFWVLAIVSGLLYRLSSTSTRQVSKLSIIHAAPPSFFFQTRYVLNFESVQKIGQWTTITMNNDYPYNLYWLYETFGVRINPNLAEFFTILWSLSGIGWPHSNDLGRRVLVRSRSPYPMDRYFDPNVLYRGKNWGSFSMWTL